MLGKIEFVNHVTGLFGVHVEDGNFSVIELLDTCSIEKGDTVSGNFHCLGRAKIMNLTRSHAMDVYIEDIYSSERNARIMVSR